MQISTHAPRTGSDNPSALFGYEIEAFQPTLPARGATSFRHAGVWYIPISTHAPRTGSDADSHGSRKVPNHFNPRSPHGERPLATYLDVPYSHFNPRSPHGERPQDYVPR